MANRITSYQEMLAEEERLNQLLLNQRQQVRNDLQAVHSALRPVINMGFTIKRFLARKSTSAVANLGIKLVVDGLIKNSLLARSGWVMRSMIPLLLKNYASHMAAEPDKLVSKIRKIFGLNGKMVRQE